MSESYTTKQMGDACEMLVAADDPANEKIVMKKLFAVVALASVTALTASPVFAAATSGGPHTKACGG